MATGITLAVNQPAGGWAAIWHGTACINDGAAIDSQMIAENFEYLKTQIDGGSGSTTSSTCPDNFSLIGEIGDSGSFCVSTNEKGPTTPLNAIKSCAANWHPALQDEMCLVQPPQLQRI